MQVREATADDVPRMVELGRLFFEETTLPQVMDYDPESTAHAFAQMIAGDACGVFLLEDAGRIVGGIAGIVSPHYFNGAHLTGQEFFWYVEPTHRGRREALRLMTALEDWAREQGAATFVFAAMSTSTEKVGRFYERRGYHRQETYYMGRL